MVSGGQRRSLPHQNRTMEKRGWHLAGECASENDTCKFSFQSTCNHISGTTAQDRIQNFSFIEQLANLREPLIRTTVHVGVITNLSLVLFPIQVDKSAGSYLESCHMKTHNLVGPQVRKLRYNRGWSQAQLAIQLQLKGLDIGRVVVAQVEGQCHCVKDKDLPYFAQAFGVSLLELFPSFDPETSVHDAIKYLLKITDDGASQKIVMKSLQPVSRKTGKR